MNKIKLANIVLKLWFNAFCLVLTFCFVIIIIQALRYSETTIMILSTPILFKIFKELGDAKKFLY